MADRKLDFQLITPEETIFQGEVDMVVAPGILGEVGILPLHAPLVTLLDIGELRFKRQDNWDYVAVDGGYLEIKEDKVTVLAESAQFASKIDIEEVSRLKAEAETRLAKAEAKSQEFYQASREVKQAINRLRIAKKAD